jgi:tetratricopeptide (TPR) repeat protein
LSHLDFDKLWDYNDPEKTEKAFREFLPDVTESGDADGLAQLLTQIARTHGLRAQFDSAHEILDQVEAGLPTEVTLGKIRYLLERGRTYNSAKDSEKAGALFLEAYETSKTTDHDYYTVDAAHMLGIVDKGGDALAWNELAMEIAEASDDERANGWLGSLYNNTGWTYHDMGNFARALTLFEKGLSWRKQKGHGLPTLIAKWTVARALRSLGRIDEALKLQLSLKDEYAGLDHSPDGYVSEEIGECLLISQKEDEAARHFAEAYKRLSQDQWLVSDEPDRLERMKTLACTALES